MPIYEYEAKTLQGVPIKGKLEAIDEESVISTLRGKSYYPVRIRLQKQAMNIELANYKKIKLKDMAIFCRQFAVIIAAGISILKGLEIVKEQTENKKLKKYLGEIFEDVQKGKTLSESMKKYKDFPEMLSNMVAVGESSGTLDTIMERMALYYDKENKLNQKIKGALTYPAVISVFAVGVVILLVTKVLPTFVGMLTQDGQELPMPTKIILGLSNLITNKWYLIIAIIIGLVIILRYYFSSPQGRLFFDKLKMRMPIFGKIYKKIVTARFARTFGTLMGSGIPLLNSIEICADVVGNHVIKDILDSTKDEIKKGLSIGETLGNRGVFPIMLTQMIKIGEESGTLDSILERTAEFYDGEVDAATAQLTSLIEPIIIIFLACIVGFIIISIVLPMFQMYSAVG